MDARFPERWLHDRRLARATHSQFRLFVNANAWAVSNRTDGLIPREELSLIPGANMADASALVALGLWASVPDGWMIEGFLDVQSSKSQLEGLDLKRLQDRQRQRAYRERKRLSSRYQSREGVRDSSPDDKGKDRQGKDRQGKDRQGLLMEGSIKEAKEIEGPRQFAAKQNCLDCTDPLEPDGTCRFCGPSGDMPW